MHVDTAKQSTSDEADIAEESGTDSEAEGQECDEVSDRWDEQKRQQAVEALLGSCAGSDFVEEAEPVQVLRQWAPGNRP